MREKDFPEQDELVLCTVDRIMGTTVFIRLDKYGKEGVIPTSEIAPGRIRNIRDYVRPEKKIVCKVLRVSKETGHIDLSLRRVSLKERTKVLSDFERERNLLAVMKTVLKEKSETSLEKIKDAYPSVLEFFETASSKNLQDLGIPESEADQLLKIVQEKPKKIVSVKAKISFSSNANNGIVIIKKILLDILKKNKEADISYLSSPNYSVIVESEDYKDANKKLDLILKELEEEAENNGCEIEISK